MANKEINIPEAPAEEGQQTEKIKEVKTLIPPIEGGPVNLMKNFAAPVKSRAQSRRQHLLDLTKTRHEKWKHGKTSLWKDLPPDYHLGDVELSLNGGVGQITYVVYMRNPDNGNKVRTPGGGPIETHLVTEKFEQGKAMAQEIIENEGVSVQEAMKIWDNHIADERALIQNRRGK